LTRRRSARLPVAATTAWQSLRPDPYFRGETIPMGRWKKLKKNFFNASLTKSKKKLEWRCHDTKHNDIRHNDTEQNDTQHNDIQHNDTQRNDIQHYDTQHNNIQYNDTQHNNIQHNDIQQNISIVVKLNIQPKDTRHKAENNMSIVT
jgi:hypothetical protein